jgi:ABC-type uncharacterized transport system permease subunit
VFLLVTEHGIILYLISHMFMAVTMYQGTVIYISTVHWLSESMQNVLMLIYKFFQLNRANFSEI